MRSDRYILSIIALVLAFAYTLWFVFAGFGNHQDPLYWLYKYEHLEGGWMAIGTLLTGGVVVRLFGAQLLPLRLFGWLCTVAAIALPYCCLLDKQQRRENLHWLALTFLLMGYGAFQEFSPGTLSVLLLSALWVTSVKSQITNYKLQILTPILLGIAVSVRFPNILALLVLIPLWKKRSLWNIPIAVLTAGVVYLLGYFFVTPAPMDSAMTGTHDFMAMVTKLWQNGGKLIGFLLMAVGVLAIGKWTTKHNTSYIIHISSILVGLTLVYFVWFGTKAVQWYNIDLTYMLSALVLVIAFGNIKSSIINHKFEILIGAIILMIATLGTDTAWLKLFPAVLCLLPVAASQYEQLERRYLCIVLALFASIVMVRMTTNSVGKTDLTKATTFASVAPYRGIAIHADEQVRLEHYIADYDSLQSTIENRQSKILAIGQENHLMRAVTGCEAARFNEFWSNIFDSVYTAKYQPIIESERPVVFVSFSPQFKTKTSYKDGASAFEMMLLEQGYQTLDRAEHKYMIYIPTEN